MNHFLGNEFFDEDVEDRFAVHLAEPLIETLAANGISVTDEFNFIFVQQVGNGVEPIRQFFYLKFIDLLAAATKEMFLMIFVFLLLWHSHWCSTQRSVSSKCAAYSHINNSTGSFDVFPKSQNVIIKNFIVRVSQSFPVYFPSKIGCPGCCWSGLQSKLFCLYSHNDPFDLLPSMGS